MPDMLAPPPPALATLLDRASVPARQLGLPIPTDAALDLAVTAAMRASDHGGLKPWRFVFIASAAREELGDLLAGALARRDPEIPAERLEIERGKPLRAPLVIAAGAALRHGHKIPVWEQEASAAAGIMNFVTALDAQGYGAIWLSSPAMRDEAVKTALGFAPTDQLLGLIYAGTPAAERPRPARPDPAPHRRWWDGA